MSTRKTKIDMDKRWGREYNSPVDGLACQIREATVNMASHNVKGSLHDENGIWIVRGRVYDPDTKKVKNRSKTTGYRVKDNTKRLAQRKMKDIISQWEREANAEPVKNDPLFSEYVEKWLKKKSFSRRENTIRSYRDYADKHILPALGGLKVRSITLQHLQTYYNAKLDSLSVNTLRKHHVIISGALLDAVRDGIITTNFADYVEFPRRQKYEGRAYTPEQVAALLEAVEQEGEPIRAGVTLAVCYGLRRSELLGLRWKDIDFEAKTLSVRNTVTKYRDLVVEAEQTKTKKSRRTIDLISSTIPYLLQLKQTQERDGLALDKVCVWPDGRAVRPDYITARTKRIMEKYGLEHIRVHDLRHPNVKPTTKTFSSF